MCAQVQRKEVLVSVANNLPDSSFNDMVVPKEAAVFDDYEIGGTAHGLTRGDMGVAFRLLAAARRAGKDDGVLDPKKPGEGKLTCAVRCDNVPKDTSVRITRRSELETGSKEPPKTKTVILRRRH